jgi:hypothetical protein
MLLIKRDNRHTLFRLRDESQERNDAQLFAQSRTLRIRQRNSLDFSNVVTTSPLRTAAILPPTSR